MKIALVACLLIAPLAMAEPGRNGDAEPRQVAAGTASAPSSVPVYTRTFRRSDLSFLMAGEADICSRENGMLMMCPGHMWGSPDEAARRLKEIAQMVPDDQIRSIWVCRINQISTLKRFGPMVDQVVLNPFVPAETQPSDARSAIWPGCDCALISTIRALRLAAGDRRLIACLNVGGEQECFRNRKASFEEVEWMIGAVVGGNFQGIAWRAQGPIKDFFDGRLERRQQELAAYSKQLGVAKAVPWAKTDGNVPVSCLWGQGCVIVVLLHPAYMQPDKDGLVSLPLEAQSAAGSVTLTLPAGLTAKSAQSLSGQKVELVRKGAATSFAFRFSGGFAAFAVQTEGKVK